MLSNITVSFAPHISKHHSTRSIMLDVIIGLSPAMIAAVYFFRQYAFILVATCVFSCVTTEWICNLVRKKSNSIDDLSAVVTGIILAFSLPPNFPVWAAIVGSVGLMSTMSINVIERGREIGVMRAIGATSVAILGIFIAEGVLLGVLSWLIAVPLSYPGSLAFNNLVGNSLQLPLDFDYSAGGMALWLMIVAVLSALASLWPALRATQVSVREALAYE